MKSLWLCLLLSLALDAEDKLPDLAQVAWTVTILPEPPKELPAPEEWELTQRLHALIVANKEKQELKNFALPVPKANKRPLPFTAIFGGHFRMGDPAEAQPKVKISPFWISTTEITWAHYQPFYLNDPDFNAPRNNDGSLDVDADRYTRDTVDLDKVSLVDAVSQPTIQYHDWTMSQFFEGGDDYPAMGMTNHAAAKFCQWLSAQTGHFYRLPTEAEWEYACRAGTGTSYHFGDDADALGQFARFAEPKKYQEFTYQKVAQLKPNPWGLYDMHGNVAEWTADEFREDLPSLLKEGIEDPWTFPTKRYPRVIRGGSWDDSAKALTSYAKAASSRELKILEAQNPKSVWYHTSAQHIGFRVVRPREVPTATEMHLFWNSDFHSWERNKEDLNLSE